MIFKDAKKYVAILITIFLALIVLFLNNSSTTRLYNLSLSTSYTILVFTMLGLAFLTIIFDSQFRKILSVSERKLLRFVNFVIFAPAALFPVLKCYFKIPYAFCHVCPQKCVFGVLRPYIIPSFLVLNLDKKYWCSQMCPFGHIQDQQIQLTKKRIKLPKIFKISGFVVLILLVLSYFIIQTERFTLRGRDRILYPQNYKHIYSFSIIVFIIFVFFFLAAFILPRLWCNHFCPIGTVSDNVLMAERKLKNGKKSKHTTR